MVLNHAMVARLRWSGTSWNRIRIGGRSTTTSATETVLTVLSLFQQTISLPSLQSSLQIVCYLCQIGYVLPGVCLFVHLFVCLFVCLLAASHKNYKKEFCERNIQTFWRAQTQPFVSILSYCRVVRIIRSFLTICINDCCLRQQFRFRFRLRCK